ncbi:MAG TPA: glycosyl hydrolase family 28-related protein [Candidatus Cybelea sp.]|nr:glycosyl hydrolase family 28-related protein [Candidatus Cybelea sp.]
MYLVSSIEYPATQYEPALPEVNGVYHEDREVNLTGAAGASQMYRTYNAKFLPASSEWQLDNSSLPAYATVQNYDGSIHYYTMPALSGNWSTWEGSDNNAVYNGVDFGMDPSGIADSTDALRAAVTAALDGGGGVIFIPAGTYQLSDVTDLAFTGVPGEDPGFVIAGAGASTQLTQTDVTKDVFSISGVTSGKGVRFKDLRISYTTTETTPETLSAAIRVASGCQNVTCERVYFKDCPQAFDTQGLQCGLFNCTIAYNNFAASESVIPTMVNLNGTENFIDSCVISQQPQGNEIDPGPAGCVGVLIVPGGGAYYVTNSHISDFTQGIVVNDGPNLTRVFCSNVICESWTNSLVIQRTGSQNISQVYCDDCLFARTNDSTDDTSIGVLIDTGGGDNSTVGDIFLNNCMCFQWNVAGVQINRGSKIVITGGRYGSNGLGEGSTGGGIAIIGTAGDVTINGADLTPKVVGPDFPNQAYALSITAAVNGLAWRQLS